MFRVIPVHGAATPLQTLIDLTDYDYPDLTAVDLKTGGALCSNNTLQ